MTKSWKLEVHISVIRMGEKFMKKEKGGNNNYCNKENSNKTL
jgi:hypothetical protein